jgi:hypothetical protein
LFTFFPVVTGADRDLSDLTVVEGFGLVTLVRGETLVGSPLDVGLDFDSGGLILVLPLAAFAVPVRVVCGCGDSCKNSRCRALANASKTSVCGHAPVYRIRTKVSLFDFEVGVQTRSVHDEYQ